MEKHTASKTITITVERKQQHAEAGEPVDYIIPFEEGMTYMDGLRYIADEIDESFALYEHSCKRGFCGACLISINGVKALSCRTLLNTEEPIYIKPALAVAKDLFPKL